MALLKALLAPVFAVLFSATQHRVSRVRVACTGTAGLALAAAVSLTSHAAARPDMIPFFGDIVHVLAAALWGGGLLCFAVLPWGLLRGDLAHHTSRIGRLVRRFSALALGATLALAGTGATATYLHVYGSEALAVTPYGRALLGKLIAFTLALGIAGFHLLVISPALTRQARRFVPDVAARTVRRLQVLVRVEAALVLGGVVLAGVLTTYTPAERPGHIVGQAVATARRTPGHAPRHVTDQRHRRRGVRRRSVGPKRSPRAARHRRLTVHAHGRSRHGPVGHGCRARRSRTLCRRGTRLDGRRLAGGGNRAAA